MFIFPQVFREFNDTILRISPLKTLTGCQSVREIKKLVWGKLIVLVDLYLREVEVH